MIRHPDEVARIGRLHPLLILHGFEQAAARRAGEIRRHRHARHARGQVRRIRGRRAGDAANRIQTVPDARDIHERDGGWEVVRADVAFRGEHVHFGLGHLRVRARHRVEPRRAIAPVIILRVTGTHERHVFAGRTVPEVHARRQRQRGRGGLLRRTGRPARPPRVGRDDREVTAGITRRGQPRIVRAGDVGHAVVEVRHGMPATDHIHLVEVVRGRPAGGPTEGDGEVRRDAIGRVGDDRRPIDRRPGRRRTGHTGAQPRLIRPRQPHKVVARERHAADPGGRQREAVGAVRGGRRIRNGDRGVEHLQRRGIDLRRAGQPRHRVTRRRRRDDSGRIVRQRQIAERLPENEEGEGFRARVLRRAADRLPRGRQTVHGGNRIGRRTGHAGELVEVRQIARLIVVPELVGDQRTRNLGAGRHAEVGHRRDVFAGQNTRLRVHRLRRALRVVQLHAETGHHAFHARGRRIGAGHVRIVDVDDVQ